MNNLNEKKENKINKHFSFNDGFINYDSGDFRKNFDSFIKNINIQTQRNLDDNKENKNNGDSPGIFSPTFNQRKDNDK